MRVSRAKNVSACKWNSANKIRVAKYGAGDKHGTVLA